MPIKRPARENHNTSHPKKKLKGQELEEDQLKWRLTVGLICAITTEYVAAQAFLDATHDPPESAPVNDNNKYTLGEIGKHNIVITFLPKGAYGTTSAANVARDTLRTFPNIRIGLMVGIGGGAPSSRHDIRPGDIIVSTPYNKEGEVFQYDFGKTIEGKEFQATATEVGDLEAKYELHGHQLEETINNILDKNSRLKKKYKRPDPDTGRLDLSGLKHSANDEANCAEACGGGPSKFVLRNPRT
ncbi:hypothetical protein BS50DRAFT_627104 [Corynespora cassiicola Philippines]|uniref:Purine and uridine phosphorylase n=1 Tax=Corynespora cassiicola Philippines TaxID=1448308 RepID=A0A2T2N0C3_CORCC|nr:hypothetical protein BS50DRAFT_627104 [Corynespora cassiicola Philippines]